MKKALLLFLSIFSASALLAQTPLPYYTGFETAAEKAGWAQFKKGNVSTYVWSVGPSGGVSSSPNVLVSPNAEFTSSTLSDTIVQWYVSPGFSFPTGGRVDSFSIYVFQASGATIPSDSIVLYLLQGSNDPALATSKTRLANLTTMVKGFGGAMKDTGNFIIPPTSGTSYIAFKYQGVYDWFEVYIDSIYISGNPVSSGIAEQNGKNLAAVYPNPAQTEISVSLDAQIHTGAHIDIVNVSGMTVIKREMRAGETTEHIDISDLPNGVYYVRVRTNEGEGIAGKFVIAR